MKPSIYFFSGPCGCGKSTLADAYARKLIFDGVRNQVYVIHGDDFMDGFVKADHKGPFFVDGQAADTIQWEAILKFSWECIISVAGNALERGIDVVIDYVIEEELPLMQKLAKEYGAKLYYVVLTASEDALRQRIADRGDIDITERSLFLKNKLDHLPENQGHLFENTEMTVEQELTELDINRFLVGKEQEEGASR